MSSKKNKKSLVEENYYKTVGLRIKVFLLSLYDTIKEAAPHVETTSDSLQNSYFNGKALPGAKLIYNLLKLGCDIAWLLDTDTSNIELPKRIQYSNTQKDLVVRELQNEQYLLKEENIKLKKSIKEYQQLGLRIKEYVAENPPERKKEMGKAL